MSAKSPLFIRLYEEWRKVKDKDPVRGMAIKRVLSASIERASEIEGFRTRRAWERQNDTCRPDINGTRLTGEMHPVEYHACKLLCPQLEIGLGTAKTKAWEWILAQPWAQDLKTSPLGRQFY